MTALAATSGGAAPSPTTRFDSTSEQIAATQTKLLTDLGFTPEAARSTPAGSCGSPASERAWNIRAASLDTAGMYPTIHSVQAWLNDHGYTTGDIAFQFPPGSRLDALTVTGTNQAGARISVRVDTDHTITTWGVAQCENTAFANPWTATGL